ncbi:MAG: HYR domain-containing protein, partial [Sphingobacteriales bacterium]
GILAQTVASNKDDYHPGELLIVGGADWQPGETVQLHIVETPTLCPNGHNLYSVVDDNGEFMNNEFLFNQNHLGVSFILTATGLTSGFTAVTTFTDGPGTEPAIHNLSASNFSFNGFAAGATTVYPTSLQGYYFATEPTGSTLVAEAGDFPLVNSTSAINQGSIRNEVLNGLSILSSNSANLGAIVVALNTNNRENIKVSFTAQQLNAGGNGANDRVSGMRLQYRVGNTGNFINIAGTEYLATNSNTLNPAQTFTDFLLPAAANNQPLVHLRWIYYVASGTAGGRDRIRLDDIVVSSTGIPAATAGIFESFAIMNFGGADVFYDLLANTSNPDFNGASLGTYNSAQSLYLDGAQNKTYKCAAPSDVLNGKLFYRIYPTAGATGAFSTAVNLPFLSNDGATGCGGQNQSWQEAAAGINLLAGRCDGNYTIEIYTAADLNSGTALANNAGANYKANFSISNSANSGIFESYIALNANGAGNTFYDLQANTVNPDFTGNLGSFCSNGSLVLAGAQNKTFKCGANDILSPNKLFYRVYPSASPAGSYLQVNLPFGSNDAGAGIGCQNQTWQNLGNTSNILTGLAAGNYTIEVYTLADYNVSGGCAASHLANNAGANYKANFTVISPVAFGTKPASTLSAAAGANCNAAVSYTFTTTGSTPVNLSYTFTGASTGSGAGTGSGALFATGITNVQVTASNACSPNAVYNFNVQVNDNTAPTVLTKNITVALDVNGQVSITAAQVDNGSTDACGIQSLSVSPNSFNCSNTGAPTTADLIFSEYIEGSSNNKALEIYNGTNSTVNLGNYSIKIYPNGNPTPNSTTVLTGTLAANSSFVIANSAANAAFLALANQTSANINFNGDDAVVLEKTGVAVLDIIGRIGNDPGTEWTSGAHSTLDATLRRKSSVTSGITTSPTGIGPGAFSTLTTEWDVFGTDNIAGLGSHELDNGVTVTLTATDNNGNVSTGTAKVLIVDDMAPLSPTLSTITGECSASATAPVAVDNCSGNVTGTTNDPTSYTAQGTYTIHWSFNDGNGNISTADQTVVVDDITAPVAPTLATITGECSASATAPVAVDNCVGNVTGTTTDPTSYTAQGTYTIHWSFNDGNGNISTADQIVVVDDITAPVAPTLATVTGECSASATAPIAVDNCVGNVTGTTTDPTSYSAQGTYTIHWSFNDGNGNSSTADQTVVVDDITAPVAPTLATITGECSASATAPIAVDNCVGNVTGTTSDPTSYSAQGTYTIHWNFNDGNGNISTADQTVVVDDITAPVAPTLSTITGECSASTTAPIAVDNCVGNVTGTTTDPTSYSVQGNYTIHWSFNDGNGNISTADQTVIVDDITAPVAPTLSTITGECSASATAPVAVDNCVGNVTGTTTDPTSYSAQGTYTIHWNFNDGNGNISSANQTVVVHDVTPPAIVCPSNIVLTACQPTATWTVPTGTDNCAGLSVSQIAGPTPGSTFAPGTTTTISYRATDVGGNTANCSFTVTRKAQLVAACTTNNAVLYFGYTGDQTANVSATITGGTAPYAVSVTMNRPLKCNIINTTGDELWIPGAGTTSSSNIACPGTGAALVAPVSMATINTAGGTYAVNVTLMADAVITFTITDANGCTTTCSKTIEAEDVRCFAGNSGNAKVTLCHQTGSIKNPCIKICVDQSAVAEHLAHGDFVGLCTTDCVAPANLVAGAPVPGSTEQNVSFNVTVSPNPTVSNFKFQVETSSSDVIHVVIYDVLGKIVDATSTSNRSTTVSLGDKLRGGTYVAAITQGKMRRLIKLIKLN